MAANMSSAGHVISRNVEQGAGRPSKQKCAFPSSVEVLMAIFLHLSDDELLRNCRCVSQLWKSVIDSQSLWKRRAERRRCVVPKLGRVAPPVNFYRTIAIKNPFGRNLIVNPCGQSGDLRGWAVDAAQGDGWAVQNPPNGCNALDTVEELEGKTSCFATSYAECRKHQLIDLWREGCTDEIAKQLNPRIRISEWYAARFDCSCQYNLDVKLLDSDHGLVDQFTFEHIEQQWAGVVWKKVEHTFVKCSGTRFVRFEHMGVDRQFWAGHYGSKMTDASVRLIL